MKRLLTFAAILSVAMCGMVHAQCGTLGGECLVDANLDASTAGGGGSPGSSPGWNLINVGNATAGQFQPGFADNTGVNGFWYRAFLGNANTPVDSDLTQDVVVPTAGDYLLTFDAVIEQNFTSNSITAVLSSDAGPSVTRDLTLDRVSAGSDYTGGGFNTIGASTPPYNTEVSMRLNGVGGGDTLTVSVAMLGGIDAGVNPQSVVIDNFSLSRIPEPTSAILCLLGTIGLFVVRRR